MAGWATVDGSRRSTSISSPRRAVDGASEPLDEDLVAAVEADARVSTWIPRAAASAASVWPAPVVSLPSERRTIRFWASSGNSAAASRSAAPMSVAARTGVERDPVELGEVGRQPLDERVLAERDDARDVALRHLRAGSRGRTRATPRGPALPTESDRSTTNTVASRSTGRTSWNPARAKTSAASRSRRTRSASPPPAGAEPAARREVEQDVNSSAGQQQQRERGVEGDAHQAARRPAPVRRPGAPRGRAAARTSASRS